MAIRVTPLPALKEGQVWQCRDQGYRAIIEVQNGFYSYARLVNNAGTVVQSYSYKPSRRTSDGYYGVFSSQHDVGDLLQLLYDPEV